MADQPSIDSVDRLHGPAPGLLFSTTSPSEMPKSLAFEFYLMQLSLEHNMNRVKQKICRCPPPAALYGEPSPFRPRGLDQPVQLERGSRGSARLDRNAEFPL